MILSHIVAASKNNVIGTEGDLPWKISEDMKFFKEKTSGHIIIAGRKTYESFPKNRPLPNRLNIVITRQGDYKAADGVIVCGSIDEAIELSEKYLKDYPEEVFIIGGGEIYKQSISKVNRIYLTRVDEDFEGDAHYPEVDASRFKLVSQTDRTDPVNFSFLTYEQN